MYVFVHTVILTSLHMGVKRGYCSLAVCVCVCVCALPVFLNCYNLASEGLAATNV